MELDRLGYGLSRVSKGVSMTVTNIYQDLLDYVQDVERSIENGEHPGCPNQYRKDKASELERVIFLCGALKVKIESNYDDEIPPS